MATPQLDAATARLLARYGPAAASVRQALDAFVVNSWDALDAWREPDIDTFVARVAPVVTGAQARLASLTDAYLAAVITANVGPTRPLGIPRSLVTDTALRGVDVHDVYQRVGPTVWSALANGAELSAAARAGGIRARAMAATDLQLARTHAARYVLERTDAVVGYARVPAGDCCDLCALASDQTYHTEDLMPIHNRCSCDVEPIFGHGGRPESSVDPDRIDALKAGDTDVAVHDHGELGPVLAIAGQHFSEGDD